MIASDRSPASRSAVAVCCSRLEWNNETGLATKLGPLWSDTLPIFAHAFGDVVRLMSLSIACMMHLICNRICIVAMGVFCRSQGLTASLRADSSLERNWQPLYLGCERPPPPLPDSTACSSSLSECSIAISCYRPRAPRAKRIRSLPRAGGEKAHTVTQHVPTRPVSI